MSQTLYEKFANAIQSLSAIDLPDALERAEYVINEACRDHGMSDLFPRPVETGLPVNRLLRAFEGRTVGEVAEVMTRLRGELADELARRGTPAEIVSELREGGARV
jgi:hypothetical protein